MTPSFTRPAPLELRPGLSTTPARPPFAGRLLAALALAGAGLLSVAGCEGGRAKSGRCHDCMIDVPDLAKQPAAPPGVKECVPACSRASDCAAPDAPQLYDASHFACVNSRCEYTGCKSGGECTAAFGPDWVCDAVPDAPARICMPVCSTPADCADPDALPLYDASHFACVQKRCEYSGCKNNSECAAAYGQGWVCEAGPGATVRSCVPVCSTPADCSAPNAPPLYDASHFACVANRCEYTGCKTTAECSGVHGQGWVCE